MYPTLAAITVTVCVGLCLFPVQPTPSSSQPTTAAGPTGMLLGVASGAGSTLKTVVYVPRDYTPSKNWPCIVFLHGRGESGDDGLKQVAQGLGSAILWDQQRWPCIVIMPQKPDANKNWEDYDAAVMSALESARKSYAIDEHRIYLTGLSQGGHGTWELGARHADTWAALAPICGFGGTDWSKGPDVAAAVSIARRVKGLPIWAFHGDADDVVKPEHTRVLVDAVKASGGNALATYYPGVGHNCWDKAYREEASNGGVASWLLKQRKP